MRKILLRLGLLVLVLIAGLATFFFVYLYPFMNKMKVTNITRVDPQFTIITGGGGNSGILISDSLVLVIDTKQDDAAEALAKQVKELAAGKPIIVVNTHVHPDHSKGNQYYEGSTIIAGGNYDKEFWLNEAGKKGVPTVWLKDSMIIQMGEERVTILNLPWAAHTQSDILVYLEKRKVLFGGDVILNQLAPAMFSRYKANGYGYLHTFDYVLTRFDITQVVPGHGPVGGVEVVNNYKDFFIDMKLAALDPSREKELLAKYEKWGQIPFLMSPSAVEGFFKDNKTAPTYPAP